MYAPLLSIIGLLLAVLVYTCQRRLVGYPSGEVWEARLSAPVVKAHTEVQTKAAPKEVWETRLSAPVVKAHTEVQTKAAPKVLLYLTTVLAPKHVNYLRECWPLALGRLPLLQQANVTVFCSDKVSPLNTKLLQQVFGAHRTTIHALGRNPGYQAGAIVAMIQGFKHGWFEGYDWVVRLNPDVLIRKDAWLRVTMMDPDVDLIAVDCRPSACPGGRRCRDALVQTDFNAFRPSAMNATDMLRGGPNAEYLFTSQVRHIIERGRDRWPPHSGPQSRMQCRASHSDDKAEVAHYESAGASPQKCMRWFANHTPEE